MKLVDVLVSGRFFLVVLCIVGENNIDLLIVEGIGKGGWIIRKDLF